MEMMGFRFNLLSDLKVNPSAVDNRTSELFVEKLQWSLSLRNAAISEILEPVAKAIKNKVFKSKAGNEIDLLFLN